MTKISHTLKRYSGLLRFSLGWIGVYTVLLLAVVIWINRIEDVNLGKTFRIAVQSGGDVRTLDPVRIGDSASYDVAQQIYDGLVRLDAVTLKVVTCLADKWKISNGGRTYTFNLQKGVYFQDNACFPNGKGRELTAEDFKYSFTRICDPKTLSTGWWLFDGRIKGANAFRKKKSASVSGLIHMTTASRRTV